jgi:hypothetical protein
MEEGSVTVLVDAKEEYTKQLISILKPCIYQGIKSIYADAKDICYHDNIPDNVLMIFQDLLSRIPKWSQEIINKEYERIVNVSKCDYIEDLLKVVYVSHIKVLTIVHSAQRNKKISLKVPNGGHFIHLCYIECAREFWKDPYLLSERVSKYEHQKNMRDSENMIAECIAECIRKQLPVRHILKEFLNEPDEEIEEQDEEDIKEPINKKYMKRLETVVKKELKIAAANTAIDVDLIRRVIKEEMQNRDGATGNDKIKKELVDSVVERVVEESSKESEATTVPVVEDSTTTTIASTTTTTKTSPEPSPITTTVIEHSTTSPEHSTTAPEPSTTAVEPSTTAVEPSTTATESLIPSVNVAVPEIKPVKPMFDELDDSIDGNLDSLMISDNEEDENDENNRNNENQHDEQEQNANDTPTPVTIDDSDIVTNTVSDNEPPKKVTAKPNIVDSKIESSKPDIAAYDAEKEPRVEINSNIDEINLNLDELDSELGGSLDLDKLKTVEPKSNKNEVTKDPNTKFIFFKEAPKS